MKYVKLFENWLNEAEEGKSEDGNFDPKKPWASSLLDLTKTDVFKSAKLGDEYTHELLEKFIPSVICKGIEKKQSLSSCDQYEANMVSLSFGATLDGKMNKETGKNSKYIQLGSLGDKLTFLLTNVEKEGTLLKIIKNMEVGNWMLMVYPKSKKSSIFVPKKDNKDEVYCDLKDLILVEFPDLESSGDIVTDTNLVITDKNVVQQQTTVGNLCSYASSNFENVAMLKDKEYGNDEYLASNVFKIENYTPFKKRLPR
jgi:hypothetical protein